MVLTDRARVRTTCPLRLTETERQVCAVNKERNREREIDREGGTGRRRERYRQGLRLKRWREKSDRQRTVKGDRNRGRKQGERVGGK